MPATASVLYVQGTTHASGGIANGDGILCIGGNLLRLALKTNSGGASQFPDVGDISVSARSAQLGDVLGAGSTRTSTAYYRDPAVGFCTAATYNFANAVEIVWTP